MYSKSTINFLLNVEVVQFEIDTSLNIQKFGINYSLEIDEIADFDINLDCLNDISFCENEANCINSVNSTLINIIDQYSEKKVESLSTVLMAKIVMNMGQIKLYQIQIVKKM